jgi:uroporphyrinogen decarboxylase
VSGRALDTGGFRPDEMTTKERLTALMKNKPRDRVPFIPFILGFAAKNTGLSVAEFYADAAKSYRASQLTIQQYGLDSLPTLGYADYGAYEFGGETRLPEGEFDQCLTVIRRPVETVDDAWNLELPDVTRAGYLPVLMDFARQQLEHEGRVTCAGMEPFAIAASVAGAERFCLWLMKEPEVCHHLLRLATDHRLKVLDHWIETFGVARVRFETATGPESNNMISAKTFERFALPYMIELHEAVLARGIRSIYVHVCGDHNQNLPLWTQVPCGDPGMLSIGQQVDIERAGEVLGDKNIIFGNLAPTTLLTGSPEEVYQETRICLEKGKKAPRGFVLMTGCEVPLVTPPYNLWAMRKAVGDFGFYDE